MAEPAPPRLDAPEQRLPHGVALFSLPSHPDERGGVTQLFRRDWGIGPMPVQWNLGQDHAKTLRGVHAHPEHTDYFIVLAGSAVLGLHDLRPESPTSGRSAMLTLASLRECVRIPPGVAHAIYFPVAAMHACGLSIEWARDSVIACRWNDPALGFEWPVDDPLLSDRDREAGSLEEARAELARRLAAMR